VESVTQALLDNKVAPPTKDLKEFVQEDFAAWYIEASKTRLQPQLGGDPESRRGAIAQRVLLFSLDTSLRLLHPFMPFVTEAIFQRLPRVDALGRSSLMIAPWVDLQGGIAGARDVDAEAWFTKLCTAVTAVRNARAKHEIPPKERVALQFWCADDRFADALKSELTAIAWLARADLERVVVKSYCDKGETPAGVVRIVVSEELDIDMPVKEQQVDLTKEVLRLGKQLKILASQLEGVENKITPSFLQKANPIAREKILKKRNDLALTKEAVETQLRDLEAMAKQTTP